MADFYYYLNRQGIRGLQGVKGDQGDSPIITVQTETPNEYILKITNPDGTELISPNLRGNKININEGTYVRYNTETGELYTSTADGATGELAGVVRLATDADITNIDERAAVTPSQLADALSQYLVSPDGSVKIVQNADTSLTELTVEGGSSGDLPIASADTLGAVKIGENLSITEDGTLSATGGSVPTNMVTTDTAQTISGDKTFTRGITTTDIFPAGEITFKSASTSRHINYIDTISGGYHAQNGYITFEGDTTLVGDNKLVLDGRTGGLKLTAASSAYITCENTLIVPKIRTTTNKKYLTEEDVDNQTIQIVDDKLHANLDGISGEINDVSTRVTTLEGQVGDISTTVDSNTTDIEDLKENKNNNIFDIGKFTVVGSPTITDDGVVSGFRTSNYLTTTNSINFATANEWQLDCSFTTPNSFTAINSIYSGDVSYNGIRFAISNTGVLQVALASSTSAYDIGSITGLTLNINTKYWAKLLFKNNTYSLFYSTDGKNYTETGTAISSSSKVTSAVGKIGVNNNNNTPFAGSIDLKQFSITVDGQEVFNGLMSSTKPIYDAIKANNTELSAFKTETSTDFSAVNSALNEKANLTDLSKCASLADFNRLSATVTVLESQVGDVSAVLDNINGEVI